MLLSACFAGQFGSVTCDPQQIPNVVPALDLVSFGRLCRLPSPGHFSASDPLAGTISAAASSSVTIKHGANVSILGADGGGQLHNVGLVIWDHPTVIVRNLAIHEALDPNDVLTIKSHELWTSFDHFRKQSSGDDLQSGRNAVYRFDQLLLFEEGIVPWTNRGQDGVGHGLTEPVVGYRDGTEEES